MSGVIAPFDAASPDNRGPSIIVYLAASCCFSIVSTAVRLAVASHRKVHIVADDWLVIASLVCQ
jgi:hypothetical protein